MDYTLIGGDCLEKTKELPDNSIDTIITDPPYGLLFMGKGWDKGVPGEIYWKEFLRVAKPGAMLFAFGGTRTHHRLMCAIEDAGWEIRDVMMWVYGSGFPKSHSIGKAVDKHLGAKRTEVIGKDVYANRGAGINGATFKYDKSNADTRGDITAPATEQAQQWEPYGTALKPAYEPIIIAMKPIDGTFANNALTWGVAGLHIDNGRIGTDDDNRRNSRGGENGLLGSDTFKIRERYASDQIKTGRWPANFILSHSADCDESTCADDCPVAELGRQSGTLTSGALNQASVKAENRVYGKHAGYANPKQYQPDTGTAARFFYTAKASKKERGAYNNHPTVKPLSVLEYLCKLSITPTGGIVFDPFMGSGSTGVAALNCGRSFIGIDITDEYVEIARRRLEEKHGKK